jgi:hypothetical protein
VAHTPTLLRAPLRPGQVAQAMVVHDQAARTTAASQVAMVVRGQAAAAAALRMAVTGDMVSQLLPRLRLVSTSHFVTLLILLISD